MTCTDDKISIRSLETHYIISMYIKFLLIRKIIVNKNNESKIIFQ